MEHIINENMKRIIITGCLILLTTVCSSQSKIFTDLSFGISGGYTNYRTFTPEIFVQKNLTLFNRPFEPKIGINYRSVESSFQEIDNLETKSAGLFAEITIFPFHRYLFAGIRWDAITLNWLTDEALKKLDPDLSFIMFNGTNLYGIAGVDIPVSDKVGFRLYGMSGIKNYTVSDGTFSSGNYVSDGIARESHTDFVYQLNVGIVIRLK
jgi:hypothetical protein